MQPYTVTMSFTSSKEIGPVIAESEEEAVKRARELTGDKFVSIQSKSIGDKLKLIYK